MVPITVCLSEKVDSLWKSCFSMKNEMTSIASGRRIFPTLEYSINGLEPHKQYSLSVHFERVDQKRLLFKKGIWTEWDSKEEIIKAKKVFHQNGIQLGAHWMKEAVSFDQIRITNRKTTAEKSPNCVYLLTQHRYIPILTIYEGGEIIHTARLEYTEFLPVTAHHNDELGAFKAMNNPYTPKSFRQPYTAEVGQVKKAKLDFSIASILPDTSMENQKTDEGLGAPNIPQFIPLLPFNPLQFFLPQFPILLTSATPETVKEENEEKEKEEEEIDVFH